MIVWLTKFQCFSATIPAKVTDVVKIVLNPGYTHLSTVDESEPPTVAKVPQYSITIPRMKDTFNVLFALIRLESISPSLFSM